MRIKRMGGGESFRDEVWREGGGADVGKISVLKLWLKFFKRQFSG